MNSLQIGELLSNDQYTNKKISGVYAANKLPTRIKCPSILVVNFDIASKSGTHWVSFTTDANGNGEYFDSYGRPPTVSYHIDFAKRNFSTLQWNNTQVQGFNSQVCGYYCCVVLALRARGYTFHDVINFINFQNTVKNDLNILKVMKNIFKCSRRRFCYKCETLQKSSRRH